MTFHAGLSVTILSPAEPDLDASGNRFVAAVVRDDDDPSYTSSAVLDTTDLTVAPIGAHLVHDFVADLNSGADQPDGYNWAQGHYPDEEVPRA